MRRMNLFFKVYMCMVFLYSIKSIPTYSLKSHTCYSVIDPQHHKMCSQVCCIEDIMDRNAAHK